MSAGSPQHLLYCGLYLCCWFLIVGPVSADEPSPPPRDDEYIRRLLLEAADEALRNRIDALFEVWMREPNVDQPRRALVGAHQAVNAYREIVKALESKDWKIIAPPAPQITLFPPPIPTREFPSATAPEHRRHRRR